MSCFVSWDRIKLWQIGAWVKAQGTCKGGGASQDEQQAQGRKAGREGAVREAMEVFDLLLSYNSYDMQHLKYIKTAELS